MRFSLWLMIAGMLCSAALWQGFADEGKPDGKREHRHDPIEIEGTPVISRTPVKVKTPRSLLFDPEGNLFIADAERDRVLKLLPTGKVQTIAEDLQEPSGLARDRQGNLYIANHAQGEDERGTIIRITPNGERYLFADGLTGPKGMAFDAAGNLYVALYEANRIVRFDKQGQQSVVVEKIDTPAGLAFDKQGNLYAACTLTGTVRRITKAGKVKTVAKDLKVPSDVASGPDGGIIVSSYRDTELTRIDLNGKVTPSLSVPGGSIAIAFDVEGNLYSANPDLPAVLKITSRFSVPCPHCNKHIPVLLKPKPRKKRRSREAI